MCLGCTSGHDNTVKVLLFDDIFHLVLGILGTGKEILCNICDIR